MDKLERENSDRVNLNRADTDRTTADQDNSQRVWGTRKADAAGIAHTVVEQMSAQLQTQIQDYLHSNPPDYRFRVDSLLELPYIAFTEYNITETPEFKAKLEPLEQKLRDLVETDEAAAQGQLQTAPGRPQTEPGQSPGRLQDQLQSQSQDQLQDQLKTTPDQRLIDEVADEYAKIAIPAPSARDLSTAFTH